MKKIIKSIPVYLTVVMLLCSMLVVPAFAVTNSYGDVVEAFAVEYNSALYFDPEHGDSGSVILTNGTGYFTATYLLEPGEYVFLYESSSGVVVDKQTYPFVPFTYQFGFDVESLYSLTAVAPYEFVVTDDMVFAGEMPEGCEAFLGLCCVRICSASSAPIVYKKMPAVQDGIYYQAFDVFSDFIYGEGVELTGDQNMVLTILATTAVLFVVVVPFLIVFFFLRLFR